MKHISKFNEQSDNFYQKILIGEYNDMLEKYNSEDKFSPYEINKIDKICQSWKSKGTEYQINPMSWILPRQHIRILFGGKIFGHEINIIKMMDGWFLIDVISRDAFTFARQNNRTYESYRKFYKCDQFDGVLNFLLNEFNNKYTNKDNSLF